MRRRLMLAALSTAAAAVALSGVRDAAACGGLVAPNGAVRLERATTLAAWHDGVEHYLTSFSFQGDVENVGWIVPLPAVPDRVVKGGSWSLQRLGREARPPLFSASGSEALAIPAAPAAQVIMTTTVDSLDITVLSGSGQSVIDWCAANHFALNDETRNHILGYASASPIFMAAKYDTHSARLRGLFSGDGTPVLITMHTPHLWVPLEVLANAKDPLSADIYLFTDERPAVTAGGLVKEGSAVPGAAGMEVVKQEAIPASLHDDLAAQANMTWVPSTGWFTALSLNASGETVTYDLNAKGPRLLMAPMGLGTAATDKAPPMPGSSATLAMAAGDGPGLLVAGLSLGAGVLAAAVSAMLVALVERRRARTVRV